MTGEIERVGDPLGKIGRERADRRQCAHRSCSGRRLLRPFLPVESDEACGFRVVVFQHPYAAPIGIQPIEKPCEQYGACAVDAIEMRQVHIDGAAPLEIGLNVRHGKCHCWRMTMQRIAPWILVLGILPVSGDALGGMQNSDGSRARPANAAPLVPVRLNVDGDFRIGPPYVADPAFTAKSDVPQGRVIRFTMNSAESKLFPTAPAGRPGGPGRGRGEPAAGPVEPPPHQTFQRQVAVYVPPGYVPTTPAPFIVVQDERWFVPEDAPAGADGKPRTDLPFMPSPTRPWPSAGATWT